MLRTLLSRGRVPYTPHPGDWDWWTFHADPRDRTDQLIGSRSLATISLGDGGAATDDGEVVAVGLSADEVIELGRTMLPGIRFTVSHVSLADHAHVDALRAAGFERDGPPSRLFERRTSGASPSPVDGFEIRPLRVRAISTYLATGFEPVDAVGAYLAPASFDADRAGD